MMKLSEEAALKGLEIDQGMDRDVCTGTGTGTDWSYLADSTQMGRLV